MTLKYYDYHNRLLLKNSNERLTRYKIKVSWWKVHSLREFNLFWCWNGALIKKFSGGRIFLCIKLIVTDTSYLWHMELSNSVLCIAVCAIFFIKLNYEIMFLKGLRSYSKSMNWAEIIPTADTDSSRDRYIRTKYERNTCI